MPRADAPEAAVVACPDCGEEQVHDVLQASPSGGAQQATVRCRECGRVHRALLRPTRLRAVPIIISRGEASERSLVELPEDEALAVGDELVAAGQQVQVRGLENLQGRRVPRALARDVGTLWAIHFEEVMVKVAVNMGQKTISKSVPVSPRDTFTVGDELDLDRLRIIIHAIRVEDGTLHRGTAEAKDIRRIFARPKHMSREERRERREALGLPPPKPRRRPWPREAPAPARPARSAKPAQPARPPKARSPAKRPPGRAPPKKARRPPR